MSTLKHFTWIEDVHDPTPSFVWTRRRELDWIACRIEHGTPGSLGEVPINRASRYDLGRIGKLGAPHPGIGSIFGDDLDTHVLDVRTAGIDIPAFLELLTDSIELAGRKLNKVFGLRLINLLRLLRRHSSCLLRLLLQSIVKKFVEAGFLLVHLLGFILLLHFLFLRRCGFLRRNGDILGLGQFGRNWDGLRRWRFFRRLLNDYGIWRVLFLWFGALLYLRVGNVLGNLFGNRRIRRNDRLWFWFRLRNGLGHLRRFRSGRDFRRGLLFRQFYFRFLGDLRCRQLILGDHADGDRLDMLLGLPEERKSEQHQQQHED